MAQALEESKVWYIYGNMYSLLITLLEQVIKNKKQKGVLYQLFVWGTGDSEGSKWFHIDFFLNHSKQS